MENGKRWALGLRLSHVILSDTSPTRLAHRTGSCKRKKKPCRIAQNYSRRKKNTPFCYPHGLPRFATSRLSLALLHPTRTHINHNGILQQGPRQARQGDPSSRPYRLSWWCHPGPCRVHGRPDPFHHPKRQGTRP